jgi:Ala-tRNA(Pro) deacylase
MSTQTTPSKLFHDLERAAIEYEVVPHRRTTTAASEARALGVDAHAVAKTVVLVTPRGFVRAVLPASERLDLGKVRAFLDSSDVAIATEETLAGAYPQFELGAVPPVVGRDGDRVLVDVRLCEHEWIYAEAGTHTRSLRLRTWDLVAQHGVLVADLCADTEIREFPDGRAEGVRDDGRALRQDRE